MQTDADGGGGWSSYYRNITGGADPSDGGVGREPGGRRRKFASYLKAANELRQSYYAGYANRSTDMDKEYDDDTGNQPSSSWPEVEVTRSGDEELVLFPSYARLRPDKSTSRKGVERAAGRRHEEDQVENSGHQEDWTNDYLNASGEEMVEEDDNVVDVDVRGWLFAPHSGPLTRKNRYLHWVALKLCGLPAQASNLPGEPDRNPTAAELESTKEATATITQDGRPASLYSGDEKLDELTRTSSTPLNPVAAAARRLSWRPSVISTPSSQTLPPQQQQQQPQLSPAEIATAHSALTARLAPFMHRPIPGTPVTIFFFNSTTSQSRTLVTSETGHFSIRAALPFLPTHVRVLASETLSATEKVIVHEPSGISLISDIDDTVKHSAVSMGAREIFRNTFTAPLSTLSIPGVADWYSRLARAPYHVNFHYVSNSPWQLYPVLKSFFEEAGLPPGSMHLKQYSGMLQGIFEPVAERKKGTVERVLRDFPQRRWILVGDSGEADLEVYTEIAERFPGRILAVFIRDVTTTLAPDEKGFFDSNELQAEYSKAMQEWADEKAASVKEAAIAKIPPPLPPKRRSANAAGQQKDQEEPRTHAQRPEAARREQSSSSSASSTKVPPPKPPKPSELRVMRTNTAVPALPSPPPSSWAVRLAPSDPSSLRGHSAPSSPPPPPLPRRTATVSGTEGQTFAVASALSSVAQAPLPGATSSSPSPSLPLTAQQQQQQEALLSKKEELWIRRWERAQMIMDRNGVVLKSWRNGGDVEVICRSIVEEALWGK